MTRIVPVGYHFSGMSAQFSVSKKIFSWDGPATAFHRTASATAVLGVLFASLLSTGCMNSNIYPELETHFSLQENPADFLSLLLLPEGLRHNDSGDPGLRGDLSEFSAALTALCSGELREAEERMRRLLENTTNEIIRDQAFSLLMRSYQYRSAWPDMQRLLETQEERVKNLYADETAVGIRFPEECIDIPPEKTVVPLIVRNGLPFVKVSVNGKPGTFLIDTGASKSILVSSFAKACGVSPLLFKDVKTPAYIIQNNKAGIAVVPELKVGRIRIAQHRMLTMSSLIFIFNLPRTDGILGWNALRHFRIEIDFNGKTISFSRPAEGTAGNRNFFWLGYPLVRFQTRSGQDVFLELDTGSHMTLFTGHPEKRGVIKVGSHGFADSWGPLNGAGESIIYVGSRTELISNGFQVTFPTTRMNRNLKISDWLRIDGLLGCDVLRRGTFVIDAASGFFGPANKSKRG